MHPDHIDHIRFSFLPAPPSHPCALSLRTERKEKHAKSNSCFPYTHWNMIKHPKASPFKDNRVLSHPSQFLQKPSIVKSYTVNLNIKTLFDGSSRLGGGRSLYCFSSLLMSFWSFIPLQKYSFFTHNS